MAENDNTPWQPRGGLWLGAASARGDSQQCQGVPLCRPRDAPAEFYRHDESCWGASFALAMSHIAGEAPWRPPATTSAYSGKSLRADRGRQRSHGEDALVDRAVASQYTGVVTWAAYQEGGPQVYYKTALLWWRYKRGVLPCVLWAWVG